LSFRIGFATCAAAVSLLGGAVGGRASPSPVAADAAGLRALLAGAGVPLARGTAQKVASFPLAWRTFQRFIRIPAGGRDADLIFEFGVFESHLYGTSFQVELTRQYALPNGALQRVHFVVHFPVAAYIAVTRSLRAAPCLPGEGCVFRCFFAGDDVLVPHPCRIVPRGAFGYPIGDMTLRASQAGGAERWLGDVESSPVLEALLSRHVRPDGYEVWQE
jgi:hypothetical protein